MRKLEITSFMRSRHQLAYTAQLDGLQFSTSLWYETVDFLELEANYPVGLMRRIYFHIIAFDANRLVSLKPDIIDFGPFTDLVTPDFVDLWLQIFLGVWGQWRYENCLPDYREPKLVTATGRKRASKPAAVPSRPGQPRTLAFCGGGKDSFLAMRLLDEVAEPFDTLAYSHSVYGDHPRQHQLIDNVLDQSAANQRHRIWIYDDFMPSPVLALYPELGIKSLTAAETPASAFAALPVAMAHGLQYLTLAHEKSADTGNMEWELTGESINHQWGKSLAAERLLSQYIRKQLLSNVYYFSILKPVHDAVIFSSLRDYPNTVASAHSCNVSKPWCRRCAKCAYVWLNYAAYLPEPLVCDIFGENLFDVEENMLWFRQLLGLEQHTPFECVGQVEESRLAFQLCRLRGYQGKAIALYAQAFPNGCSPDSIESFFAIANEQHMIPADLAHNILPLLTTKARQGRNQAWATLGWTAAGD